MELYGKNQINNVKNWISWTVLLFFHLCWLFFEISVCWSVFIVYSWFKKKKNLSSLKSVTWFLSLLVTKVGTGNCSILSLSDQILMELYGKNQINNVKILDWLKSWIVYRNFSLFYRLLAVGIKFVSKSTTVRLLSEWCNIVEYGVSCGSLENVCFCKRHHHFSLKL